MALGAKGFGNNLGHTVLIGTVGALVGGSNPVAVIWVPELALLWAHRSVHCSVRVEYQPLVPLLELSLVDQSSSIFGGNKQRRRDEQTRNQGTLDALEALKQFDSIISDVRTLRIDPASGIAQGTALGDNVRSQYLQMANSLRIKDPATSLSRMLP